LELEQQEVKLKHDHTVH